MASGGYAKLEGPLLTVFITQLKTTLGRNYPSASHICLGQDPKMSKFHAEICWNASLHAFTIQCLGKNSILVNRKILKVGDPPAVLKSQSPVKIASTKFYFLHNNASGESSAKTEIKSAFYKLVKLYHPDVNPGATAKFKEIHSAYTLLLNTPNYKEEKPFDPGEEYQFRQQNRGNFYWSQTQQEEKREEEKKEKEPKKVEGRHTEKIVLAFVAGVLLMRFMLAEGKHQQGQYIMNKPYEVSLDNYLKEVDNDDEHFERYVKARGLDQSLRRR